MFFHYNPGCFPLLRFCGIVDTGEKCITGVVVTGDNCSAVSTTPVINLSPVSTTPPITENPRQRLIAGVVDSWVVGTANNTDTNVISANLKKIETILMGYSGPQGTLIHEKNWSRKSRVRLSLINSFFAESISKQNVKSYKNLFSSSSFWWCKKLGAKTFSCLGPYYSKTNATCHISLLFSSLCWLPCLIMENKKKSFLSSLDKMRHPNNFFLYNIIKL